MTLINLRNLGVTLAEPLFSNLNLTLDKGDRIGVVAANGRGKSTLLAAIAGQAETTHGEITTAQGLCKTRSNIGPQKRLHIAVVAE